MKLTMFRFNVAAAAVAASALLAACGGGGGSSAPALTAQTITFAPAATGTVGTPITLAGTATSGLAVSYSTTTPTICTASASTLTLLAAGACTVKADQAGNGTYAAATQVSANITVSAAVVSGNTGTCTATAAVQCYNFSEAGMAMVAFGNGAEVAGVVADPVDATNKVMKYTTIAASPGWAGGTVDPTGNAATKVGRVVFGATQTATLRVYSPGAGRNILLKFEDSTNSATNFQVAAKTTMVNAWETLTFDFSLAQNAAVFPHRSGAYVAANSYDRVSIFPDFGLTDPKANGVATYYFDELKYATGAAAVVVGVPSTAAPTPTVAAANVVSIYSGAYTGPAVIDTNPNWGQSTVTTTTTLVGNDAQKYVNFNYQGIDFATNPVNVSTSTNLHIDLWSADATSVKVFIVSAGPVEQSFTAALPVASGWNSINIPMSNYTTPNKNAIIQIKLESIPFGGTTVYMDNLYFWK